MTLARPRAAAFLKRALMRGAAFNTYQPRGYQITAAHRAAEALAAERHVVLTLPTGTGKTVICGMAAALFLRDHPAATVAFTAPRRMLLTQLRDRSRWLNPTAPTHGIGFNHREDDRHVLSAFAYARVIFAMPDFLANRIRSGSIPQHRVDRIKLLIVDEFDAFLTMRYLAHGSAVSFYDSFRHLIDMLPADCQLLLVSATTPELPSWEQGDDPELELAADQQTAFRRFLDTKVDPVYVTVPERSYRAFAPHAHIIGVAVTDVGVRQLDRAISDEVGTLLNWISGTVGHQVNASYVFPRLKEILAGRLPLAPGRSRGAGALVKGFLARLLRLSHLPDFVYEDMAAGFDWDEQEVWRYAASLKGRYPVTAGKVLDPPDPSVYLPEPRNKLATLLAILSDHRGDRGVLFFRNIRILEAIAQRLVAEGWSSMAQVHGEQSRHANERALDEFRSGEARLLLITRDTGKRGLDLPEADYAVFYSPKSREDVTWQEASRIRSTVGNPKRTYILFYCGTGEEAKWGALTQALARSDRSLEIDRIGADEVAANDPAPCSATVLVGFET